MDSRQAIRIAYYIVCVNVLALAITLSAATQAATKAAMKAKKNSRKAEIVTTTSQSTPPATLEPPTPPKFGPSDPSRFKEGDDAWNHRKDEGPTRKAYEIYKKLYEETPEDADAAWRLSMACYHLGIRYTPETEEKKRIHKEGIKAGEKGIELNEKCTPCHFWTAINLALYADAAGPLKQLFSLGSLRGHLEKVMELNPDFANAGAMRLYGQVHHKSPGILGGSHDEAKKYYEAAIKRAPREPLNFQFYAEWLEERGQLNEAVAIARQGLAIEGLPYWEMEGIEAQDHIRRLLSRHPDLASPAAATGPAPAAAPAMN
jgi:tetratricopeptide (TPR) repeat protein